MPAQTTKAFQPAPTQLSMLALSLSALGVVFGDIGTSPLYTLKTVLDVTARLVLPGFPGASPELCGTGGVRAFRRTHRQQHLPHLLPPLPRAPAAAAGTAGHGCDRHRQPGGDRGRLFDDAP